MHCFLVIVILSSHFIYLKIVLELPRVTSLTFLSLPQQLLLPCEAHPQPIFLRACQPSPLPRQPALPEAWRSFPRRTFSPCQGIALLTFAYSFCFPPIIRPQDSSLSPSPPSLSQAGVSECPVSCLLAFSSCPPTLPFLSPSFPHPSSLPSLLNPRSPVSLARRLKFLLFSRPQAQIIMFNTYYTLRRYLVSFRV